MTAVEVARRVVEERQAYLVRFRMAPDNREPPYQYDAKPYGEGADRGWMLLDLYSASAIVGLYDALAPANRELFDRMDLFKMARAALRLLR